MSATLAPLLATGVVAVASVLLAVGRARQRRLVGSVVAGDVAGPAILFFSGKACTVCHTAQRPVLERLRPAMQGIDVREIDVAEEPTLARRFRVMSLPTTVLLDAEGRAVAVNPGFAPAALLRGQLASAGLITG